MCCVFFFFFNDTATTEIYTVMNTLSLHDALPISRASARTTISTTRSFRVRSCPRYSRDRKSTRLNSSHSSPSRMPSSAGKKKNVATPVTHHQHLVPLEVQRDNSGQR